MKVWEKKKKLQNLFLQDQFVLFVEAMMLMLLLEKESATTVALK
jgi:hypothetical protein